MLLKSKLATNLVTFSSHIIFSNSPQLTVSYFDILEQKRVSLGSAVSLH